MLSAVKTKGQIGEIDGKVSCEECTLDWLLYKVFLVMIAIIVVITASTDLRSDGILYADDTDASHLGDDFLFVLPVRFDSHLNVVGTWRI